MTLQEGLTLAIFAGLFGFVFGCWSSTPLTRFVMRRNRMLYEENRDLKSRRLTYTVTLEPGQMISLNDIGIDEDDADWWKSQ